MGEKIQTLEGKAMTKKQLQEKVEFHQQELAKYSRLLTECGDNDYLFAKENVPFNKWTLGELDSLCRYNERAYKWFAGDEEEQTIGHRASTIKDYNACHAHIEQIEV